MPSESLNYASPAASAETPLWRRLLFGCVIGLAISTPVIVVSFYAVLRAFRDSFYLRFVVILDPVAIVAVRLCKSENEWTFVGLVAVQYVLYGLIISWQKRGRQSIGWLSVLIVHFIMIGVCKLMWHW